MGEHELALKISNIIAYLAVLGVNIVLFANCSSGDNDNNDDGSSINPLTNDTNSKSDTFLSPPEYAESIFGLIYLLLGGFVIYQWCPPAKDAVIEGIGWDHVIASVLNVSFVLVWVSAYQL
ncbi:3679_t:CDS:1 [Paraglomus brasilianum]|uniref:3679_t:CDS:1 n=1 Tax=Paraglomus brasilianum TaxID=144538 RepID=A0A9N8WQR0_9GLOM|nr:3679_t:CDS:1 [Paraglomus brasilianum]